MATVLPPPDATESLRPAAAGARRRVWRRLKDRLTRHAMTAGGVGVIAALVLIFVYLVYVVVPLFAPAATTRVSDYPVPGVAADATEFLALDEYAEIGLRITRAGDATFFRATDGTPLVTTRPGNLPAGRVTAFGAGDPAGGVLAFGLDDGRALVFRHQYAVSFPDDRRSSTPSVGYPLGEEPIVIDEAGGALRAIDVQVRDEHAVVAALLASGQVAVVGLTREENMLDGSVTIERRAGVIPANDVPVERLALSVDRRSLYVVDAGGKASLYDVVNPQAPRLLDARRLVADGHHLTAFEFGAGGISVLVGDDDGTVNQWFPVRDEANNYRLERIRDFPGGSGSITAIAPEHGRKGFIAVDAGGHAGIHHMTAHRTLLVEPVSGGPITATAICPRADAALYLGVDGRLSFWRIENHHPEVSWRALWGRVWYESRPGPDYIWQSSAATSDFEPKFSLMPLAFGTLKAAFYAMLFAVPLAVGGALYAGYFMSPAMRGVVKPAIEVMAALPTVILGFLAGLWLAPIIEHNLAGVFLSLLMLPLAVVVAARLWSLAPAALRHRIPEGWEAALLLPVVCGAVALAMVVGEAAEVRWFGGDLPRWLTRELGIGFDQRNSLVVGLMMGFAVIPTVFSISEDAVFGVPRQLTVGSLALGATPWQTMVRVVLLTASPGIFSGVMIGLGRAVGETMIVLMATGNTPVIDMNVFQGFRALSANIAVEMPESEVGSTHYRVLFLAALVLFLVTFVFNTVAEVVRQRLRARYASL